MDDKVRPIDVTTVQERVYQELRNALYQGRFMPGVHLPIYPPERLLAEMPEHVLLLTWNFADEILEQQAAYRKLGGQFIIPVPEVKVA